MSDVKPPAEDNPDIPDEDAPLAADEANAVRSPISGLDNALGAGAALLQTARSMLARRTHRLVRRELPAYLFVQSTWFMAFGLQMVLLPHLITNRLGLGGSELGVANLALSAPSVIFLLLGGVVAERASGKTLLIILHALAALPALSLSAALYWGTLTFPLMLIYGAAMGTVGAFMMPARDSILNEVVDRRTRIGSSVTLQQAIAFATVAQFAAQIFGLILGGYADKATRMPAWLGGFEVTGIASWRLLMIQGLIVAFGAIGALILAHGQKIKTGRTGITAAFGDMADGFRTVRANPRLWAMTALMFGVGIFVIGSFLVVLPLINRDVYHLEADGIRDMFVTFWFGAFVSSVALSVFRNVKQPGRLLLGSQLIGSLAILAVLFDVPHWAFLIVVFVWGLAGGISIAMSRSIVQDAAPKDQLARVLSIYQLGFMAGAPFGAYIMGKLTDIIGPHTVAIVPAIGMLCLIGWMIVATPIWNLKLEKEAG